MGLFDLLTEAVIDKIKDVATDKIKDVAINKIKKSSKAKSIKELEDEDLYDEDEEVDEEDLEEDEEEEDDEEEDDELDSSESPSSAPSVKPQTDSIKEESVTDGLFSDRINKLIKEKEAKELKANQPIDAFVPVKPQQETTIQASQPIKNSMIYNYEDMYSAKINRLMELALADGELTEKEKQILFKNAEQEGIDLDEFEMVLEAKLIERTQQIQETQAQRLAQMAPPSPIMPQQEALKSDKNDGVKKCPACGAMLQSFQTNCPDCGHEIGGVTANESIERLFGKLNEIEEIVQNNWKDKKETFWNSGEKDIELERRKIECIKCFPIPTTKESILEFLCLAVPLAKKKGFFASADDPNHNVFAPVWKSKCEQIIIKARFAMKEDKATLAEIEGYAKELNIK
jgi:hypothetical protein